MAKYFWYILFALVIISIGVNYFMDKQYKTYKNFDIKLPMGYYTHGIDVSHHQGNINWKMVKDMRDSRSKIDFVFIKATEGTSIVDARFETNWEKTKENNLIRGAYLYFHPNNSGAKQAQYFINKVTLKTGDLAPVIDIEETNGVGKIGIVNSLNECIAELEKHYKTKPIIYANADYYNMYLKDSFENYPLWVAHYYVPKPNAPNNWVIWQHNDKGHVNGINTAVDFNTINGGLSQLLKYSIK